MDVPGVGFAGGLRLEEHFLEAGAAQHVAGRGDARLGTVRSMSE